MKAWGEKWMADSGASFHVTHSDDLWSDVRLCEDKVGIVDNHLVDVVGVWHTDCCIPSRLQTRFDASSPKVYTKYFGR